MILTLRTDKPISELGLFDIHGTQLTYFEWEAHRALAETIHGKIRDILAGQGREFADLDGVVAFKGPGSFTGLRIGLTVANALAYSYAIPVVATDGEAWIPEGLAKLAAGTNEQVVLPEYGAVANITAPKK